MKFFTSIIILLFAINAIGQTFAPGFVPEKLLDGLNPVGMTLDHHGRVWIIEKQGRVLIVNPDGKLNDDPFINIEVDDFNERGLLGITLHPDFDLQPYVYLYYTVPGKNRNRVSRFLANGDLAVPNSEEIILELDTLRGSIHNAGAMVFDNEGFLYIATGEAGFSPSSQDLSDLNGKILRIHDDGTIPDDNPFYFDLQGNLRTIWCYGLRNPFHLEYDITGDRLFASDVGAGDYEEINLISKGKNYGWPLIEGPRSSQASPNDYQDPYFYYDHEEGCSIVGLHILNGSESETLPDYLKRSIIYADYCDGYIKYLPDHSSSAPEVLAEGINRPLSVLYNSYSDQLFFLTRAGLGGGSQQDNTSTDMGQLWSLAFNGNGSPIIIADPEDQTKSIGEDLQMRVRVVGEEEFEYKWFFDNELVSEEIELIINNIDTTLVGLHEVYCVVNNDFGSDTSAVATIKITKNTRPSISLDLRLSGERNRYRGGDTIYFNGLVTDLEEGNLPSDAYKWTIDFHHDEHRHPFIADLTDITSGFFIVPVTGEPDTNVWIRVYLEAQDSEGLTSIDYKELFPEVKNAYFTGNAPGIINIDGASRVLPYAMPSVTNLHRTIIVPEKQIMDDSVFIFKNWGDGSMNSRRDIIVGATVDTFHIDFEKRPKGTGTGLYAEFYNKLEAVVGEPADHELIIPTVNYDLAEESPFPGIIGNDNFSIRIRGYIEPLFSEDYTFYLVSDDGARMWIDDSLVVDEWYPHPALERQVTLPLKAGEKYRIRIDYFEAGGNATLDLSWSSPFTPKESIPTRQLYPARFGHFHARIWEDTNVDGNIQENEEYLSDIDVILLNEDGHLVDFTRTNEDGFFAFRNKETNGYRILVIPHSGFNTFDFGYGLNDLGYSNTFEIKANELIETRFALINLTSDVNDLSINEIKIYPNPMRETLFIESKNAEINSVSIYNVNGKLLLEGDIHIGTNAIDTSDLPRGLLILKCKGKNLMKALTIMKY